MCYCVDVELVYFAISCKLPFVNVVFLLVPLMATAINQIIVTSGKTSTDRFPGPGWDLSSTYERSLEFLQFEPYPLFLWR